ncbi:MAG: XRE family transcriptional regulator [Clostridia bacterium]|nr:XRE family transcriptional regulator [Clostridia bacterium]
MARRSIKENKTVYQRTRESLDLTREEASDLLVTMSPERIEKIENERSDPHPDEVLLMSDRYKQPSLCNYYCANQCPIGQQYVPEIKLKDLSQIVLETVASLNAMQKRKERLIEITVDGCISGDELADFVYIQEELEKISVAVESLQLWCERMMDTGAINKAQYKAYKDAAKPV